MQVASAIGSAAPGSIRQSNLSISQSDERTDSSIKGRWRAVRRGGPQQMRSSFINEGEEENAWIAFGPDGRGRDRACRHDDGFGSAGERFDDLGRCGFHDSDHPGSALAVGQLRARAPPQPLALGQSGLGAGVPHPLQRLGPLLARLLVTGDVSEGPAQAGPSALAARFAFVEPSRPCERPAAGFRYRVFAPFLLAAIFLSASGKSLNACWLVSSATKQA